MRNALKNVLLSCAALLVALMASEGLVRWLAPQDLLSNFSWYESNETYRFRHRPHLDRRARWGEEYHLRTNSQGLREDREIPFEPTGRPRIAVVGDSFVFGNGLDRSETFLAKLEDDLAAHGIPGEVVNFGVSAYGPSLELLYYREVVRRYRADVVVLGVFLGNDVLDDQRDRAFRLEGGRLVARPYSVGVLKRWTDSSVYQFVASHSHLWILIRRSVSAWAERRRTGGIETEEPGVPASEGDPLALSLAVWTHFIEEVRDDGAVPVFLLLPPKELLGDPPEPDAVAILAERTRGALLDLCRRFSVRCVDAQEALERRGESAEIFLERDFHYNEAGHEAIAGLLLPVLLETLGRPAQR